MAVGRATAARGLSPRSKSLMISLHCYIVYILHSIHSGSLQLVLHLIHVEVLRMKHMPTQCISFKKRQMTGRRATEPILQYWTRLYSQDQSLVWPDSRDGKVNMLKDPWRSSWRITHLPSPCIVFIHFSSFSCFSCHPILSNPNCLKMSKDWCLRAPEKRAHPAALPWCRTVKQRVTVIEAKKMASRASRCRSWNFLWICVDLES